MFTPTQGGSFPPPAPGNAHPVYQQPVQPIQAAPVQPVTAPVQPQSYSYQFIVDKDNVHLINSIPEIYRDFIINFGIKLALEQPLVQNYITGFKMETNEYGVTQPAQQANPTVIPSGPIPRNGMVGVANVVPTQPEASTALAGFKSW